MQWKGRVFKVCRCLSCIDPSGERPRLTPVERLLLCLFGRPHFTEDEEYQAFRYRLLIVLLLTGSLSTWLFVWGDMAGVNRLAPHHRQFMAGFASVVLGLWWALRGRKKWFYPVAWGYQIAALAEYAAAWFWAPQDELRLLWLMVNVPGVYILLGQRVGAWVTAVCLAAVWWGNARNPVPYSGNAQATLTVGLLYLAVFFHVYANRSLSYFKRMREANQRLHFLAHHDALTGVLNARAYADQAQRHMTLARRQGAPCAVLFVDLDHFKRVNDTHGHAAGDVVLRSVAETLTQRLRSSDVLGRVGGEEFCALLPHTDLAAALRVAEGLREAVEALRPDIGTQRLCITASIGVACDPGTGSLQSIQHAADEAMYRAKAQGRNRVSVLEPVSTIGACVSSQPPR